MEQYLNEQSSNNRMAGDIFIMATAVLTGLDFHINSAQCNQSQPVNIIKRYWQEADIPDRNDHPFLLIGHFQQLFQSLIPVTEMDTNQMFSYSEVVKHSVESSIKGQEDKSNTDIVNSVESSIKGQEDKSNTDIVNSVESSIEGQEDKSNTDILNSVESSIEGQEDKSNTDILNSVESSIEGQRIKVIQIF